MDIKVDFEGYSSDAKMNYDMVFGDIKDVQSCAGSIGGQNDSEKDGVITESSVGNEDEKEWSRKRKRDCYLPMLDWVKTIAKNPSDLSIGSLPERRNWKAYGSQHVWKQVLLAREAMLSKVDLDSKSKEFWKKKRTMHPTMYEDRSGRSTSRCSQRLISVKESQPTRKPPAQDFSESSSTGNNSSDVEDDTLWALNHRRKRIPLGRSFQAPIPEWTGLTSESQSETKWLGTPIWPLDKGEPRSSLIEREPMGKGRQDSCGCQFPGSPQCVRFHISEKRKRVKLELGSAFYKWKFDNMGEDVSAKWSEKEQKKFEEIVKSNPESSGKRFWDEILSYFKNKSKKDLVSYYFNVYLLRRRGCQNRFDPRNIDSDDDELEKVGNGEQKSSESILCSPKKVHLNSR